jgi:uncharacterized protein involved in response to NO
VSALPKGQTEAVSAQASPSAIRERQKSLMLRAWILSGLFFMVLPGTLLGFSNLVAISQHHGLSGLSAAWIQGHGHAQMFGWIGSFILGIGFYSQPAHGRSVLRVPLTCFVLWTAGVTLRWSASIYGWHWRTLFVVSASAELLTLLLFLSAARHHKLPDSGQKKSKPRIELWMTSVFLGTAGLLAGIVFNFVECLRLAVAGTSEAFPHDLDQRFLIVLAWAFLVPTVWGFSARWLPTFLGIGQPREGLFRTILLVDIAGILLGVPGFVRTATVLFACVSIAVMLALRLAERPRNRAKVQGIHPSFPTFIRVAYAWLMIAAGMSVWAAVADQHDGIWGASRHALTVGFAATMVFSIGPRILPHFGGIYNLFSKRLMLFSLLLLQLGCMLRVSSEPLAYEGFSMTAWKVLPISASLELAAVLLFAVNLVMTYARGQAFFASAQTNEINAA